MTLKNLIINFCGLKMPISGGFGKDLDTRIIIHKDEMNDYIGTQRLILNYFAKLSGIEYNIIGQELHLLNGIKVDEITIETKSVSAGEILTQRENYYFDITECVQTVSKEKPIFDEAKTLKEIKERILELEKINSFNQKCIALLRTEELLNDTTLTIEFLKVIFEDKSLPLFKMMMGNRNKPILDVLRIIGKDLNKNPTYISKIEKQDS